MPQSARATMLKHFTAMQLILGMDASGMGLENDTKIFKNFPYTNIDYIIAHECQPDRVPIDNLYFGLDMMRDMINLIDEEVYKIFHHALKDGAAMIDGQHLDVTGIKNTSRGLMAMLQHVSKEKRMPMWGGPPHPCKYLMREVVADLLRD